MTKEKRDTITVDFEDFMTEIGLHILGVLCLSDVILNKITIENKTKTHTASAQAMK